MGWLCALCPHCRSMPVLCIRKGTKAYLPSYHRGGGHSRLWLDSLPPGLHTWELRPGRSCQSPRLSQYWGLSKGWQLCEDERNGGKGGRLGDPVHMSSRLGLGFALMSERGLVSVFLDFLRVTGDTVGCPESSLLRVSRPRPWGCPGSVSVAPLRLSSPFVVFLAVSGDPPPHLFFLNSVAKHLEEK